MTDFNLPSNPAMIQAALQLLEQRHGLILIWADENLNVQYASRNATMLLSRPGSQKTLLLTDFCLELIGLEEILKKIACRQHDPLSLAFINREISNDTTSYLDLFVYPAQVSEFVQGLLLVIFDTTTSGNMSKQLRQLRAEKARLR